MEQLPKIVRERLAAAAKPGTHPDPDLLAAFAENSLLNRERNDVLGHLSHCEDCRDVVALAAPQVELEHVAAAVAVPAAAPAIRRSRWFQPPMLRWAALAAGIIVVGAAVLVYRQASEKKTSSSAAARPAIPPAIPKILAKLEPAEKPSAPPSGVAQAPGNEQTGKVSRSPAPAGNSAATEAVPAPMSRDLRARAAAPGISRPGITKKESSGDETRAGSELGRSLGGFAPAQSPEGAANAPVAKLDLDKDKAVAPSNPKKELGQAAATPPTNQVAAAQAPTPSTAETLQVEASTAKTQPATSAKAKAAPQVHVSSGAFAGEERFDLMRATSNTVTPRWVLSGDGTMLLRSTDDGKTWQTVPVASHVVFLSLDAFGPQVWAGGGGGALYHSADAGEHWVQVKAVANGKPLTDDVTHIHFTDAQRGELLTLHHQVWSTSDGGQTWQVK